MHCSANNCILDRVSGADEEEVMPIISNDMQNITNAHSDTNTNDEIASKNAQTKDQKPTISDILPHSREETIRSYTIWSTNDNSVDRQHETKYNGISRQDYNEKNDTHRLEQRQIHKAMTQYTPVKTTHNLLILTT